MGEEKLTKKQKREIARKNKREAREKDVRNLLIKKFVIRVFVLVVVGYLGYQFVRWVATPVDNTVSVEVSQLSVDDWVKGTDEESATLIEYGDFQCPACAAYAPIVAQLVNDNSESLKVVYRHFPLNSHLNALPAAKAAEAAGLQGKFWEMHDKLYEGQDDWSSSSDASTLFVSYASDLGLDVGQFTSDMKSDAVENAVNSDLVSGNQAGVNSTPSFILNGETIVLTHDFNDFVKKVVSAINN